MQRSIALTVTLVLWAAAAGSAQSKAARTVEVPKGTPIVVETYNAVNSATFHSGERMAYTISEDVIVNGAIVAKAGDRATGLIENAVQGHKVHAGTAGAVMGPAGAAVGGTINKYASTGSNLRLSVRHVITFCGATISVSFTRSEYHRPRRFGRMTPVQIAKGQKYVTTVEQTTEACGAPTTRTPPPIPSDALHSDSGSTP